jgi:cytidylate kinase
LSSKFSIVISGWPAVGKTTIASSLAAEFKLKMYNGGDILKMLAAEEKGYSKATERDDWWDTEEAKKFMSDRRLDPSFDRKVDEKLLAIASDGGAVMTSYTIPWLARSADSLIKFWLKGSAENRAHRMAKRDKMSLEQARKIVGLRDEENTRIYKQLYGYSFGQDLEVFDYMLNTDALKLESLIEVSKILVQRHMH